jgi:hypothetical protein
MSRDVATNLTKGAIGRLAAYLAGRDLAYGQDVPASDVAAVRQRLQRERASFVAWPVADGHRFIATTRPLPDVADVMPGPKAAMYLERLFREEPQGVEVGGAWREFWDGATGAVRAG